jgi:hypothetical protein
MVLAICYPLDRFNGLALDITHHTKTNFYKMILVISLKIAAGLLFTQVLQNVYGIVIANYIATIGAIIYGHYQLRKYLPHTILGILSTGYSESILFLSKKLQLLKKKH